MKRFSPLLLAITFALLICAGLLWKIVQAADCMEKGGVVIASMSRNQHCADP
jgi:hypothetical protein